MLLDVPRSDKPTTDHLDAIEEVGATDPFANVGIDLLRSERSPEIVLAVDFCLCFDHPTLGPVRQPLHSITLDNTNDETRNACWLIVTSYLRNASAILANSQRYATGEPWFAYRDPLAA